MSSTFYFKLAFTNLKKNHKTYIPYLLTCIITIMMFYCLSSIARNSGLDEMPGGESLKMILSWAVSVTGMFAAIFLFYTNSFLVKQRKKELGVYQVLGMDKRNLAKMEVCETLITAAVSLVFGLGLGILFGKLMFLVLLKMVHFPVPLSYSIEPYALAQGAVLFLLIFAATLLMNLFQVSRVNAVELLKGGSAGEKEPKTKWLLVLIGVACMSGGYGIALTVEAPLTAIPKFFFAVILVVIGTYCLFIAGSIAFFKMLKKRKGFYYQTRHFISVSGMIYRMKQNAVGLANICIMSTIVLVLVSISISLYAGIEDAIAVRYPTEFKTNIYMPDETTADTLDTIIEEETKAAGIEVENKENYYSGSLAALFDGSDEIEVDLSSSAQSYSSLEERYCQLIMIPLEDYNQLQGEDAALEEDEVLIYSPSDRAYTEDTLKMGEHTYKVKEILDKMKLERTNMSNVIRNIYVIMPDMQQVTEFMQRYGYEGGNEPEYNVRFDLSGKEADREAAMERISARITEHYGEQAYTEIRSERRDNFYKSDGGFLFLGIFVGALFLMATVLVIYYKQISEGYSDRERYQIMQKVGMDKRSVRRCIKSQVLLVFFLPLIAAVIHLAVAFKVMAKLLEIMYMTNIPLFALCTGAVVMVFVIFYIIVFGVTSREYYKIVK